MSAAEDDLIDQIVEVLADCQSLLFITGAGISAESGLPTYRGVSGLYNVNTTEDGLPIEEILSRRTFRSRPELTWKYLAQIGEAARGTTHNRAHEVIAEMERHFERVCTLTQNVDGFHRSAGSQNVIEIHGHMHDLVCPACGDRVSCRTHADFDALGMPPICRECSAILRPDVVLFGESLPQAALQRLEEEKAAGFDIVFSVGTSSVFPYILIPVVEARRSGIPTVEINPSETDLSDLVAFRLRQSAGTALDTIWKRFQQK